MPRRILNNAQSLSLYLPLSLSVSFNKVRALVLAFETFDLLSDTQWKACGSGYICHSGDFRFPLRECMMHSYDSLKPRVGT